MNNKLKIKHAPTRSLVILGFLLSATLGVYLYISSLSKPKTMSALNSDNISDRSNVPEEKLNYLLQDNNDGTQTYLSNTGYSLKIPKKYTPMKSQGRGQEHIRDGICEVIFTQGGMGELTAQVVPYSNESLKELHLKHYPYDKSYDLRYEDHLIQDRKSMVVEAGPVGDSGSGTRVFIPVDSNALVFSLSYLGKDTPEFKSILESINVKNELDISDCGQNRF